jgi:hypothetical protein
VTSGAGGCGATGSAKRTSGTGSGGGATDGVAVVIGALETAADPTGGGQAAGPVMPSLGANGPPGTPSAEASVIRGM